MAAPTCCTTFLARTATAITPGVHWVSPPCRRMRRWKSRRFLRSRSDRSTQLVDRLPIVLDDVAGAAAVVEIGGVQRDAEVTIDRGGQVAGSDGPVLDVAAVALGGADHLAMTVSAA